MNESIRLASAIELLRKEINLALAFKRGCMSGFLVVLVTLPVSCAKHLQSDQPLSPYFFGGLIAEIAFLGGSLIGWCYFSKKVRKLRS